MAGENDPCVFLLTKWYPDRLWVLPATAVAIVVQCPVNVPRYVLRKEGRRDEKWIKRTSLEPNAKVRERVCAKTV